MTTKRFCDICGKDETRKRKLYGEIVFENKDTGISAEVHFLLWKGESIPTLQLLCPSCADDLILKLLSESKRKEIGDE